MPDLLDKIVHYEINYIGFVNGHRVHMLTYFLLPANLELCVTNVNALANIKA